MTGKSVRKIESGDTTRTCRGPMRRRAFLEVGGMGLGGMGLADLLRAQVPADTDQCRRHRSL
jgi:hypothetical protein